MTSKEFILWFSGFVDAVEGIPTQTQWDLIKSKLSDVGEPIPFPFGGMLEEPLSLPKYQQPRYIDQHIITCTTGSDTYTQSSDSIIATTGYGYITYNPSTATQWNPSGSNWSYTDALDKYSNWYWTLPKLNQPTSGSNQLELDLE